MEATLRLTVTILCLAVARAAYLGARVGSLSTLAHQVSGEVYALNHNTLRILNFNYDGEAPLGRFYVGMTGDGPTRNGPGDTIPDEKGSTNKLGRYTDQTVTLVLPAGMTVTSLRWLSVWCVTFTQDFGHVDFPPGFTGPSPYELGQFSRLAHGVRSGQITVQDTKTITIKGLHYDGRGPDAYFIVGTRMPVGTKGDYWKIPDQTNSTSKLSGYSGQDITLVLPRGTSIHDIRYLSMYCIRATQDFGNVVIPADLAVPFHPVTLAEMEQGQLDNCETLGPSFNLAWSVNSSHITFEFSGFLDDPDATADTNGYAAFGLSGSNSESLMIGGDVIVVRYGNNPPGPLAQDYYLQNYAQCSNGRGACPDEMFQGGKQDTRVIGGSKVDRIVKVKVVRALNTGDSPADKPYTPGTEQYVIWAFGRLNPETFVTKHAPNDRLQGDKKLDFGRTPSRRCSSLTAPTESPRPDGGWDEQRIRGNETDKFMVTIGPTGGRQGFAHITGEVSWGIAYWINGLLIPRLQLKRGVTYTFTVKAGDDTTNTARYHPFYLTTHSKGGYVILSQSDRQKYEVFTGIDANTGLPLPNSVGPYCEYLSATGTDQADTSDSFKAFVRTLKPEPECYGQTRPGGTFTFTPDANTPDRIYYQCYTHLRLGWEIDIVDEYKPWPKSSGVTPTPHTAALTALLLCVAALLNAHLM